MIRLRTLGSSALADAEGRELRTLLRQPKRFALLVYLALARPRGFQRRDALLAMFWPELDTDRGRGALRQALYTLRRALPEGTLINRGDGEVGLAIDRLWCDVHEMERRIGSGRPDRALELYGGPLLDGFHVPDASPELDYWLSAERERLRQLALQAAGDAMRAAEAAGDLTRAARLAAHAVEIAPLDEESLQQELRLAYRTGDRSGGLLHFERWSSRLEEELGLEPSPETVALAERLRRPEPASRPRNVEAPGDAPTTGATPPPAQAGAPAAAAESSAASTVATAAATRSAVPVARQRPRMTRLVVATALLVLLIVSALVAFPFGRGSSGGESVARSDRLMVLPFTYRGGPEAAYLSEGLVHLFSVAMDGADLRSIDPRALVRRASASPELLTTAAANALAEEVGADLYLLGSAIESEGQLQLAASLYARGSERPLTRATATGTTAELLDLVDELAAELLTTRASSSRVTRLAAVTTSSLPALKAYLHGERLLRENRFAEAIDAFEEAVLADTLFALAHYRMSLAASWAFRGDLANRAAERAVEEADRLPERERRLLAAHQAYRRGDASLALDQLRDLSALYPEDPEIWYRLGELILHLGPLEGWPIADAREPFLRAAALEPRSADARYHLAQIDAASLSGRSAIGSLRLALDAAPSGARAPQLRALEAGLTDGGAWDERLAELADEEDFTVVSAAYMIAVYLGRPALARSVARLLTDAGRPRATRSFGHLLLADLELALGRWTAARHHLDSLAVLDPARAEEEMAMLAAAPAAALSGGEARRLLRDLAVPAGSSRSLSGDVMLAAPERLRPLSRAYARGLLAGAVADTASVRAALETLRSLPVDSTAAAELGRDLELVIARAAGEARTRVPVPAAAAPAEVAIISGAFSRPARRYQYARQLEREGDLQAALRWYESLAHYSIHDLPWAVPALLDRARVHERLGQPLEAARLYERFGVLWRNADRPRPRQDALVRSERLRDRRSALSTDSP